MHIMIYRVKQGEDQADQAAADVARTIMQHTGRQLLVVSYIVANEVVL